MKSSVTKFGDKAAKEKLSLSTITKQMLLSEADILSPRKVKAKKKQTSLNFKTEDNPAIQ